MDERLTLRLGTDVPVLLRRVNRVGGAVVLDHGGVAERNVGGPPVEVVHRVATRTHHLGHQPIRVTERSRRIVDESALHGPPAGRVLMPSRRRQRNDVELVAYALAPGELLPGGLAFPGHRHGTLILGTERLFEPLGPLATTHHHSGEQHHGRDDHHCRDHDPYPYRHFSHLLL